MHEALKTYISELNKCYATGVAREHAYRPALQNLMIELLPKNYTVVNEPARSECGAPDFIILKGDSPLAFIEAKDLQDTDLDGKKEHREQFERYRTSLDHIVFTDYLDFHLYENGEFVDAVRLADIRGDKIVLNTESVNKFLELISRLANATPQRINSPVRLAKVMASKARLLAQVIEKALDNDPDGTTELAQQMTVFKELLIHDLNNKTFADIYAQTIAYGLFSARLNDPTPEDFSRMEANALIPKSNPFLRKIFNDIAGFNIDSRIEWIVDDLVEAFRATDMEKVMKDFGEATKRNDPMMHFYEDFLSQYDPQTKAQRGVYYTPQPVVDFIVRAVDDILKRDFGLPMGLADSSMIDHETVNDQYTGKKGESKTVKKRMHRVQILDPATGTGTFLATVIRQVHANMEGNWGAWNSYVEQHLLPRLNGFELMMASYTIAHLKLSMVLRETGFTQQSDKRLRVYLTNSLEEHNADAGTLFSAAISNESNEASYIKRDTPVMVMIGNPPYSGISSNNGDWINNLIGDYKKEPGGLIKLQERKNWLNDDYVKFIRLAQNFVDKNDKGIVGFINNNGFLDNPTFRGMRWTLLRSFDKAYIINLHGNAMKNESAPNGEKDENVFDIRPGVSINLFVKTGAKDKNCLGNVYYADLWGNRQYKYEKLKELSLDSVSFKTLKPIENLYLFVPQNIEGKVDYDRGFAINELLPINVTGVVTARDGLVINADKEQLIENIKTFVDKNYSDDDIRQKFFRAKYERMKAEDKHLPGDSRGWSLSKARNVIKDFNHYDKIKSIAYRPLDNQFIYYCKEMVDWGREDVFGKLPAEKSIVLVVSRQAITDNWSHVLATRYMCDNRYFYSNKGITQACPLYIERDYLGQKKITPNLNDSVKERIEQSLGEQVVPEELFDYIYAVLHSPAYRTKYKEFLKIDFPRIPYPTSAEEYHRLSALGNRLRKIHLMEEVPVTKHARFNTAGSNMVEKPEYKCGNVWINKEQCFEDVPETAWNFYIGGYQPAQKWLKDRKGRELTFDNITHYRKIIAVLLETDVLMKLIDGEGGNNL